MSYIGSPPRGRGKGMTSWGGVLKDRITPAWAGKRRIQLIFGHCLEDHPRVGGEKCPCVVLPEGSPGSPPRGRGKVQTHSQPCSNSGITPAWAGKRHRVPATRSPFWDHPRVGGEKIGGHRQCVRVWGSPPRGRGKVHVIHLPMVFRGITPAWAGKRQRYSSELQSVEDHPRMGGEKMFVR